MRRLRNLFSVKPLHPIDAEGRMALGDHFRELRGRLMRSVAVIAVLFFVGIYFNEHILELIMGPYNRARAALGADVLTEPVFKGVGGPFLAILKMSAATAIIAGSPVWLYQLWRYILPALHKHERKWSHVFIAVAGPLFLGGVALGYYILRSSSGSPSLTSRPWSSSTTTSPSWSRCCWCLASPLRSRSLRCCSISWGSFPGV